MGGVMIIEGKVCKLGNNIDTDTILPGKYLSLSDPSLLGEHCLEGLEMGERISVCVLNSLCFQGVGNDG